MLALPAAERTRNLRAGEARHPESRDVETAAQADAILWIPGVAARCEKTVWDAAPSEVIRTDALILA
jgi:hypothetical protein